MADRAGATGPSAQEPPRVETPEAATPIDPPVTAEASAGDTPARRVEPAVAAAAAIDTATRTPPAQAPSESSPLPAGKPEGAALPGRWWWVAATFQAALIFSIGLFAMLVSPPLMALAIMATGLALLVLTGVRRTGFWAWSITFGAAYVIGFGAFMLLVKDFTPVALIAFIVFLPMPAYMLWRDRR